MIRLPENRTSIDHSQLLYVAVEAGLWEGVGVAIGYGPSYGVGNATKAVLAKKGGEIRSQIAPLTLVGVPHRGTVGPWVEHYWWLEVTVAEFATRDEDGELDGGLSEKAFQAYLYENRFRFSWPESLLKYVEKQQARIERRAALARFVKAAGFVKERHGWKDYKHPAYGIRIDTGGGHDTIAHLERGTATVKRGHPLFDCFLETGEILTELLGEVDGFKIPVSEVETRTLAEAEYLASVPRTVYEGVEFVDMYGRWRKMRAYPQADECPEGCRYVCHLGGGAWYTDAWAGAGLAAVWQKAFAGENTLRVDGHLPGEYSLELEGNTIVYTVLDVQGNVRINSLEPFETLAAADDYLSNRSGRPTQSETRRKVRKALGKK